MWLIISKNNQHEIQDLEEAHSKENSPEEIQVTANRRQENATQAEGKTERSS